MFKKLIFKITSSSISLLIRKSYRGVIGLISLVLIFYVIFDRLQKLSPINSAIFVSALSVLAGFLLDKLVFQSVISVRHAKQNLAERLTYYAYAWSSPGSVKDKRQTEAQETIRSASTLLRSRIHSTPLYNIFWITGLLPYKKNALKACKLAIGISNSLSDSGRLYQNLQDVKKIETFLNISIFDESDLPKLGDLDSAV